MAGTSDSASVHAPTVTEEPFREIGRPILVLAGPGTGKTYQLARRIQFLVDDQDVSPDAITVITFTREAARGMRERLNTRGRPEFVDPSKQPKNILTMHGLGHKIIDENAELLGLHKGVRVVADALLKKGLMRDAAVRIGLREADGLAALVDKGKANPDPSEESARIQAGYREILTACNAIDYDDQIALACEILATDPEVLARYKAETEDLLVDEYQDINADQDRLIQTLTTGQTEGLFAVGDDDQSLYGFRGGDPQYIRKFAETYPGAAVLQLQVSRRCLKNILDCALTVVTEFDTDRAPKIEPSYTESDPGLVQIWNCPSEQREANLIAKLIVKKSAEGDAVDFFVLVPNRNYVKPISQALDSLGVAHEDATAGARSTDWSSLRTVKEWLDKPSNLVTRQVVALILSGGKTGMPGPRVRLAAKKDLRQEYAKEVAEVWDPVLANTSTFAESLEEAAGRNDQAREIWDLASSIATAYASGDISRFLEATGQGIGVFRDVTSFYRCLETLSPEPRPASATGRTVRILTLKGAKGLEADCVFIVGLEEGSIPSDLTDREATAEEARDVFVAMTRARKELHLTHVRKRTGASSYLATSHNLKPSSFITTLPTGQCSEQYVAADK